MYSFNRSVVLLFLALVCVVGVVAGDDDDGDASSQSCSQQILDLCLVSGPDDDTASLEAALQNCADIDIRDPKSGQTPLMAIRLHTDPIWRGCSPQLNFSAANTLHWA